MNTCVVLVASPAVVSSWLGGEAQLPVGEDDLDVEVWERVGVGLGSTLGSALVV
jgi:ABC-type antimicrobial peptide transport system permease subunit